MGRQTHDNTTNTGTDIPDLSSTDGDGSGIDVSLLDGKGLDEFVTDAQVSELVTQANTDMVAYAIDAPVVQVVYEENTTYLTVIDGRFKDNFHDKVITRHTWQVYTDPLNPSGSQVELIFHIRDASEYRFYTPHADGTTLYVRAWTYGGMYRSRVSRPVKITAQNMTSVVDRPVPDPTGWAEEFIPEMYEVVTSFSTTGGSQIHVSTHWKVMDLEGLVVWEVKRDTVNLTNLVIPQHVLKRGQRYMVWCSHQGSISKSIGGIVQIQVQSTPLSWSQSGITDINLTNATGVADRLSGRHTQIGGSITGGDMETNHHRGYLTSNGSRSNRELCPINTHSGAACTSVSTDSFSSTCRHIMSGGVNSSGVNPKGVYSFDIEDSPDWTYRGAMHVDRNSHTMVMTSGGVIVVLGGVDSGGSYTPSVEVLLTGTDWTTSSHRLTGRSIAQHGASAVKDELVFVTGGRVPGTNNAATKTTWLYSYQADTWYQGPDLPVGVMGHGQVTLPNGLVMIIGGNTGSSSSVVYTNRCYIINPFTGEFFDIEELPVRGLYGHCVSAPLYNNVAVSGGMIPDHSGVTDNRHFFGLNVYFLI